MTENEIGDIVVPTAIKLHQDLDPGLFESVYETVLAHRKQLLTYLRLMDLKLGYLLNFGSALMKDGITRIINGSL